MLPKREGNGGSPLQTMRSATSKQPGMTGTGAPVTEQLRCRLWPVIRVVPRSKSPLFLGATFILQMIYGGRSNE